MATKTLKGQTGEFYHLLWTPILAAGVHRAWGVGVCLWFIPRSEHRAKWGAITQTGELAAGRASQETVGKCVVTVN